MVIPNLRTRRGLLVLACGAVTFAVLDVLALLGSDLATGLLIYLAGILIGAAAAFGLTHPIRGKLSSSGGWRLAGIALALASVFGVVLLGTALARIPPFPTAEGGNIGDLVFGLALGVGLGFGARLNTGGTVGRPPITGNPDAPYYRAVAVVLGAVAALFGLFFVLSVLLRYVAAPLIRALAA